jgi:haloalkane dehalogenase
MPSNTRKKGIRYRVTIAAIIAVAAISGCATLHVEEFPLADEALPILTTSDGVDFVRTPDIYFENLSDWPYEPKYVEIDGLRQAYVDVGPTDADETILLLHGQPSWSYLYRKMIPVLADAGYRVIAMDHLGMGRSDKPIDLDYYTYQRHVDRLYTFIEELELLNITPFVQDWGSLIGLNVIGNHPELFARVVVGDGALPLVPEGEIMFELPEDAEKAANDFQRRIARIPAQQPEFYDEDGELRPLMQRSSGDDSSYFGDWIHFSRNDEDFRASLILEALTYFPLTAEEKAAYDAPFPARIAMGGPRSFPGLANTLGGATLSAWEGLAAYEKPFLAIWASNDPGNLGRPEVQQSLIDQIPGAAGQPHTRLPQASHFLQDDQGDQIARLIVAFIEATPAH